MRTILLVLLLSTPAFAEAPPDIPKLIAQLGSPDFRTREAASEKLRSFGADSLKPLQDSIAAGNPEANRRAELLIGQIRRKLSDEAAIAPKIIAVKMFNVRLQDAFDELRKQTNYEFRLNGDAILLAKEVTLDTEGKVPFWAAVAKLCEAAKLELEKVNAPVGPMNRPPVNVPQPTLTKEETILKEFREAKLLKLEIRNTVLIAQREQIKEDLPKVGLKDRIELQQNLIQVEAELKTTTRQIAAFKELLAGKHELPSPTGTITLRPRGDTKPNPSSFTGGIRIEAVPLQTLAAFSRQQVPVKLRISPEPGVRWLNLAEIVATNAVDQEDRELKHEFKAKALRVDNHQTEHTPPHDSSKALDLFENFLTLQAPPDKPALRLTHLEGLIRANVWSGPEEILSVSDLKPGGPVVKASTGAAALSACLAAQGNNKSLIFLDVNIEYEQAKVKPTPRGASGGEPAWIGQGPSGQAVLVKRPRIENPAESIINDHGLILTDAAGKPFAMSVYSGTTTDGGNPGGPDTFAGKLRISVRPVDPKTTGAPATLSFHGTRMKEVEFPFVLKDVPVSAGTGK